MALSTRQKTLAKVLRKKGQFADSVSPSDRDDLELKNAKLFIGTGGNLKLDLIGGNTITLKNIPSGTFIDWIQVKKVHARDTTARDIVAIY